MIKYDSIHIFRLLKVVLPKNLLKSAKSNQFFVIYFI